MAVIAMALPILPGKIDSWRQRMNEITGERWDEFGASRRRQGVTRQRLWLQQTPAGNIEIILLETNDPARTFGDIATSQELFDVWFHQFVLEHYGLDLTQPAPGPPSELIFDWPDER